MTLLGSISVWMESPNNTVTPLKCNKRVTVVYYHVVFQNNTASLQYIKSVMRVGRLVSIEKFKVLRRYLSLPLKSTLILLLVAF